MLGLALLAACGMAGLAAGADTPPPTQARVIIVQRPGAIVAFAPQLEVVRPMIARGLTNLTGKPTLTAAWRSLVSTQDVVGLKVVSDPGPTGGTRPAVAAAVVEGLLAAGLPPQHVIVWDKHLGDLRQAGFVALHARYGVRVEGALEAGYDPTKFYDSSLLGQLVWGDSEFGKEGTGIGRKSYVSKLVSHEMTKLINLTPLLNHNLVGVNGNLYSLSMGSIDNTLRFVTSGERLATAVPEVYALPILGDRVVLNIVDALLGQYYGEDRSLLHYTFELNQLRFSTDPVALDVLSIQELEREREAAQVPAVNVDLSLYQNANLLEIGVSDTRHIQVDWLR